MKYRNSLLIVACLVMGLLSCKKGNNGSNYPVIGKWQQTALRIYVDSSGIIAHDTTYYKPFTDSDYVQFKDNNTCTLVNDHYYYDNTLGYPKTPQKIPAIITNMNYTSVGSKYVLNPQVQLLNYAGFFVADTATVLTANTLLLHVVFHTQSPGYTSVTDSYYRR